MTFQFSLSSHSAKHGDSHEAKADAEDRTGSEEDTDGGQPSAEAVTWPDLVITPVNQDEQGYMRLADSRVNVYTYCVQQLHGAPTKW
jgi:hypothetical protein